MMIRLMMVLALLWAVPALAADLRTEWNAVTADDAGNPLPAAVDEYRVYACGASDPIATVPGSETEYLETGVVAGSGTYCREVAAYLSPFEGARAQGVVVLVVPGQSSSVRVQAIQ